MKKVKKYSLILIVMSIFVSILVFGKNIKVVESGTILKSDTVYVAPAAIQTDSTQMSISNSN